MSETVTVSNTTLYHVAAEKLGDATQWIVLAQINGLSDPQITAPVSLKIPSAPPPSTDGIPQQ
ncbi:hypothetical protein [Acidocella aminolytica]|uniref:LysM domain-containing protein n=1 Tax=Acidocella aminolytica 101 = DSM 11237 TaxID=1120923 RepID=A0A0D6PDD8_9PROT|nr:hypothetical protein [Acidocella aminolytica]GAN79770.1 hypothetical protein Aam_030_003 [Acidocella aminolytica 101 = DSM 11237]GBQ31997.1 hypothetical protein AA11237_0038 [Acidocella aminolytica 101 = DSM 11237]SHF35903.1 hypothetical protein SAMN02746095_02962 [Acidocella aminolytica 101 = DSM 11237]